jgi:hypothetical protein
LRVPLIKGGLDLGTVTSLCEGRDPFECSDRLARLPLELREGMVRCLEDFWGIEQEEWPNDCSLLDWEMISDLASAGVSFGAHTDNHVVLTCEEESVAEREIQRSKQILEERLGQPVRHFAYPTGGYNAAVKSMLKRAGFETAVTTERRINRSGDDLLALGRISLCEESTRGVTGCYSEAVARLRLAI